MVASRHIRDGIASHRTNFETSSRANRGDGEAAPDGVEVIYFLEDQNSYSRSDFSDLVDIVIPHEFWTMPGIDWLSNAVTAHGNCYCDVSMSVEVLMSLFPGQHTPVEGAQFVGDCLLVNEPAGDNVRQPPARTRGRPPAFAWEAFHVEVADLIKSGLMPQKKEAAIQHMMSWFESTQGGKKPSRSAVSEKLTPYYRRFFSDKNRRSTGAAATVKFWGVAPLLPQRMQVSRG